MKNVTFPEPVKATYHYAVMTMDRRIEYADTPVDVIEEAAKRYKVILHEPIRNHFVGDKIWVDKSKIYFAERTEKVPSPSTQAAKVDCSEEWWNNN